MLAKYGPCDTPIGSTSARAVRRRQRRRPPASRSTRRRSAASRWPAGASRAAPSRGDRARLRRRLANAVTRRAVDQRRQRGRLGGVERRRGLAEVAQRRGLHAVVALAEIHVVQVGLQNRPLAVLRFEPVREPGFADLAAVGLRAIEERAAHELLRDGAAALDDAATAEVGDHRPEDAAAVNAVVVVEAAILGGQHGGTSGSDISSSVTGMRCSL